MELENLDIIGLVRGMGLTPDQLAAIIRANPVTAGPTLEAPERKEDGYEAD